MDAEKPYLDPELRITDLVTMAGTNRAYLSRLINKEYGMNFAHYINYLRIEEMERLRQSPTYRNADEVDLTYRVGFSSYRGYKRYLKELATESLYKPDDDDEDEDENDE
jgi:AraC-like DNA-binding protein